MKKWIVLFLIFLGISWIFGQKGASADIINGDFSNGLNGWTTDDNIWTTPSASVTVNADGQAELWTQGYASEVVLICLWQQFTFPADTYALSFDIGFFDKGPDTGPEDVGQENGFFDALFVSYVDDSDWNYHKDFLGFDLTGPFDPDTLAPLTLFDLGGGMYRFTTVLGSAYQNRSGTLYFSLFDDTDLHNSLVKVDNVQILAQVPDPSVLVLLGWGLLSLGLGSFFRRQVRIFLKGRKQR